MLRCRLARSTWSRKYGVLRERSSRMSLWVSRRSPSQENRLDAAVVNHAAVLRRSFLKSCKSHAIHLVQQFLPTIESALILLACGYGRYEKSDQRRAALANS